MASEISLFSQKDFIKASADYVCVRLGTYESKEHQDIVRDLLKGSFQNTAFVVYAPDGKTKLTRSGRVPKSAFGDDTISEMSKIVNKYKQRGASNDAVMQDFHSFKQSLNVASADQRLLLLTVASEKQQKEALISVQQIFVDEELKGRFHFDTIGEDEKDWTDNIKGSKASEGFYIVRSGTFGQEGEVMGQLALDSNVESIKKALLEANSVYAKSEERKTYNQHVKEGRKKGIDYLNTMAPGEDRDGDGVIDKRRKR